MQLRLKQPWLRFLLGLVLFAMARVGPAQEYHFTTIVGQADVPGLADGTDNGALFNRPSDLAVDSAGTLYVSDTLNNTIRRITPVGLNWVVTTIASSVGISGTRDGTNTDAQFYRPNGIAVDHAGTLFVADHNNHTIRKVVQEGSDCVVTTLAGLPGVYGTDDGANSAARFRIPMGIAVDGQGRVAVVDTANFTIRLVTPQGSNWVATTIAGTPLNYDFLDGLNEAAAFNYPYGMALGPDGALYVTDAGNCAIRRIAPVAAGWSTDTIANYRGEMGSDDGQARFATFDSPNGIAVDTATNIFVADQGNHTIRKLTYSAKGWEVTTIGGIAGVPGNRDGMGTNALFRMPWGIAVDRAGTLFIADAYNHTIRRGVPGVFLQAVKQEDHVIVSWPKSSELFQLESATSLHPPDGWQPVTSGIVMEGDRYLYTNRFTGQACFYRLKR